MPEIIPQHVPSPRTLLAWDGTAYRPVTIDAAGQLQIDVVNVGPPFGVASWVSQSVMITALQRIDDLAQAIQGYVPQYRLQVRGSDQLHSFAGVLAQTRTATVSAADGYVDSTACAAGRIWHLTNIEAHNRHNATTAVIMELDHDGIRYMFHHALKAAAVGEPWIWRGDLWLDPADFVRVFLIGSLVGNTFDVRLTGETMTLEV